FGNSVTATNATLSGSYSMVQYHFGGGTQPSSSAAGSPQAAPTGFIGELVTLTFDGAGGVTTTGTLNNDGATSPESGTATYAVAADGTLTMMGGYSGHVRADGNAFVVETTSAGTSPKMGVAIRHGGGA